MVNSKYLAPIDLDVAEFGTPRRLRTDNGAEYTVKKFKDYYRDSGIKQEFTVSETPQQDGMVERFNRTLVEMERSLLIQAKLPKRYWVRALSTAVLSAAHIRNLTVTPTVAKERVPLSYSHHQEATKTGTACLLIWAREIRFKGPIFKGGGGASDCFR